jgi:hypothetical protein
MPNPRHAAPHSILSPPKNLPHYTRPHRLHDGPSRRLVSLGNVVMAQPRRKPIYDHPTSSGWALRTPQCNSWSLCEGMTAAAWRRPPSASEASATHPGFVLTPRADRFRLDDPWPGPPAPDGPSFFAINTYFSRSKHENFKILKKLITPIAIATLSCNVAFAQETVVAAAAGEEQITTTTTITRRVAAAAAVSAPVAAPTPDRVEVDYTAAIAAVKRYVTDYIRSGESTSESSALELGFYADNVDYFDNGIVDRAFIAKDVRNYSARWPNRAFHIEDNHVAVRAVNDNTVRAEFVLQFTVRNLKKSIRGAVRNVMLIDYSRGEPKIVSIKSNTISRREFPAVAM